MGEELQLWSQLQAVLMAQELEVGRHDVLACATPALAQAITRSDVQRQELLQRAAKHLQLLAAQNRKLSRLLQRLGSGGGAMVQQEAGEALLLRSQLDLKHRENQALVAKYTAAQVQISASCLRIIDSCCRDLARMVSCWGERAALAVQDSNASSSVMRVLAPFALQIALQQSGSALSRLSSENRTLYRQLQDMMQIRITSLEGHLGRSTDE